MQEEVSEMEEVRFRARDISVMTDVPYINLLRAARTHKYCFLVPVVEDSGRRPRGARGVGYIAIYTRDRKQAFVFTNNSYWLKRKYAKLVKIVW